MTTSMRVGIGAGLAGVLLLAGCSGSTSGSSGTDSAASSQSSSSQSSSAPASSSATSSASGEAGGAIKASLAAAKSAKTVHIAGSGKDSGQTVALDIHYGSNGSNGFVTMAGSKISLIFVGSTVYFKAPDSFYRKQAGSNATAVLKLVSGKWVKAPSTSTVASSFKQLSDRQTVINSFAGSFSDSDAANVHKTGSSTVDGVATTTYSDNSNKGTFDIAASGPPYPMKLVSTGTNGGTLTFTDWNKPYSVSAPPAGQTVQLPGS